ncbi:alpha/beta fold hydrolase [Niastella sp. OAS944]|uniref:alpha/beta fold hydrolase n=1 Tax=Niastella sp. OAS944 TaxID=2664089 RepID=UPI003485C568|nr:proline iminopeptidase [Chitinophagaceae bacterium OAS944]
MKKAYFLSVVLTLTLMQLFAQNSYVITMPDSVKLHVNEYGEGMPVVLLGGGPGFNPNYLVPICQQMPGYRFIIPHQRGSGKSIMNKVDSINMSTNKHVEDLEALRIHLKLSKLIIAGHSWGGMLGFAYAAKYPEKVDRLILLGSGGISSKFFAYFNSNINMRLHKEDKEEGKNATGILAHMIRIWPGYFYSRERAVATRNLFDSTFTNPNYSDVSKFALKSYIATETTRIKNIRKYKNPVIVIQGRQDPVGESTVYETKDILPQTQINFIEKCGHLPWLEEDKAVTEFYRLLRSALEKNVR